MMMVLGLITMFFITVTTIIIFFCTSVVGLAVLDYLLDSDIKGALVSLLGPRHLLKKLRIKILKIFKKYDTASQKDELITLPEKEGISKLANWKPRTDYNMEIDEIVDKIRNEYCDALKKQYPTMDIPTDMPLITNFEIQDHDPNDPNVKVIISGRVPLDPFKEMSPAFEDKKDAE